MQQSTLLLDPRYFQVVFQAIAGIGLRGKASGSGERRTLSRRLHADAACQCCDAIADFARICCVDIVVVRLADRQLRRYPHRAQQNTQRIILGSRSVLDADRFERDQVLIFREYVLSPGLGYPGCCTEQKTQDPDTRSASGCEISMRHSRVLTLRLAHQNSLSGIRSVSPGKTAVPGVSS